MSGPALQYPFKPHEVSDDVESFTHVLSFHCLRFHVHTMSDTRPAGEHLLARGATALSRAWQ